MKKLLFQIVFFLMFPLLAVSQWSTDPGINNPIITLTGEQAISKIATCPNGDSYIASFSSEGGNYNVRMQRLDPQGNEVWETNGMLISNHPQMSWLTDWDMTADNSNHAILTFQDIRNGGNNNVVAYRIAPDGSFVWGNDGIALSNSIAFDASPKVTSTTAGNAVFAWQADDVIIIQKVSPDGSLQWGESGITLSCPDTYSWPQLLPVGNDEVILKYFHDTGPSMSPTRHVYAQRYNASGSPVWSSPASVSTAGGISAWTQIFSFISDGSDGFYIAWHDDRDNNLLSSTFVQHISSDGIVLFPTDGVEASTMGGRNNFYPQLALPPGSTNVFVYWNEMSGDQNQRGLYGQKISSSGTRMWTNNGKSFIELSSTNVSPIAACHSPTDMVLIYEEDVTVINANIKAMRIDEEGNFVWTPNIAMMCSVNSEKLHPEVNHFNNNQWIVSWTDDRNGNRDIFAQNIQLTGELGPYYNPNGIIEGVVSLAGGSGTLTNVEVTAGGVMVHPDEDGFYSMEVEVGTWDVIASLAGYYDDIVYDVIVLSGQTTSGVDLTLNPFTGFVEGTVTLNGGSGNVEEVQVGAGGNIVNPDAQGNYLIELNIGTWDVTASLTGYYPQTIFDVIVTTDNTTSGVDFVLDPIPGMGFVEGIVELENNAGDVTQVNVTAGFFMVHPDISGYWLMELPPGTWDISASLPGFITDINYDVEVFPEQTTSNVDFYLFQELEIGYIEGYVSMFNGTADVTEATINANTYSTNPTSDGHYLLEVSPDTYTVYASHPYALTDSIPDIVVENETTVSDVDFNLEVVFADLICRAYDTYGNILNDVEVEVVGPENTYTGTIENDSLVFSLLPYGSYLGSAWYDGLGPVYAQTELDENEHYIDFIFNLTGFPEVTGTVSFNLNAIPNPFNDQTIIRFDLESKSNVSLSLYNLQGNLISTLVDSELIRGEHQIDLFADHLENNIGSGMYIVVLTINGEKQILKILKR